MQRQLELFSAGEPTFDASFASVRRIELLHGAWVEYAPGWVGGQDALFDHLVETTRWHTERRVMYDREVDTPRLLGSGPPDHPVMEAMRAALSVRYGEDLTRVTVALYRDGADSVAPHGDTTARDLPQALVATVSLGARRRFLLRPAEGGASLVFALGAGDLFVMGGSCQRTWRHSVPKVRAAGPRIAVMFRPVWE